MEALENKKYYEWISGSRRGKVEVYLAEDDNQVYFESGRFISKSQLDTLLRNVDESLYLARGGESQFTSQTPQNNSAFDEWEKLLGNPEPTSIAPPTPIHQKEKSAIQIILEKQKKFSKVNLTVSIPLNFPSEKAIEFMTVMFDEEEVLDEVSEFIYSQMSSSEINELIKTAIKNKINQSAANLEE
jgi:hypothetical protein